MKLYRNAIILVVILGMLMGAYFIINNKKAATSDSTAESTSAAVINFITVEKDKINSLEFKNENGSFMLKKQNNAWTMEPASELPIDITIVDSSATTISKIDANMIVEENATDFSKYGLDKPSTVKIGLSDGSSKEIEIGSSNPTNDGVYVKNKGESKVYLISTNYADSLKVNRGYFIKKDILPVDATKLKKFAYEKNSEMQYSVSITSESKMEIVAPRKEEGNTSKIKTMLENVVQLKIKDIVDENPADIAEYGLDKPAYCIEYGDGTTTKKILFGKDVEKGSIVYAKFPEGKTVFTIDISPLQFLDVKLSDVVYSGIYMPDITEVNKIDLYLDGKTIVSDITTVKDKPDENKYKVDGKDANMKDTDGNSLFENFYTSMANITMDKYEPNAKPSGTPEVTIKYYIKPNLKAVTIDLISKDSNYYFVMKDGVYTNKLILKNALNDDGGIRTTYQILKKAIDEAK